MKNLQKGDCLQILLVKGNKGNIPVGRADNGKMCLIDRDFKGYWPYNSIWECEIVDVKEKVLIVRPRRMISPAFELKHAEKKERSRIKRLFPFMSANEKKQAGL